jgi:hypothetical protein
MTNIVDSNVLYRIINDNEFLYLETNDRSLSATKVDYARLRVRLEQ